MALQAGKLRHRILIQKPVKVKDPDYGDDHVGWQDVVKVWAAIEPLSVKEFIAANSTQSKVTARILIRYRSSIDATMRIVHKDKIYSIEGVLPDPKSGKEYLTLSVSEGVNDG